MDTSLPEAIEELPSLTPVLAKLDAVIADPKSSADDMAKVLKLDPALAGRVLRLANSAYVGLPQSVGSIKSAVVLLGQKRIRSLAITSGILSGFKTTNELPFALAHFWRHSIGAALVAESVTKYLRRYATIDGDEAFAAGLLHDVGKLAMACFHPHLLTSARKRSQIDQVPFYMSEDDDESHVSVGGMVARHWNFPAALSDVLIYHHTPGKNSGDSPLVSIIHVADIMVHMVGFATFIDEIPPKLDEFSLDAIKMQPEHLRVIASETLRNEKAIESFINFFIY
jgi:putative nucleotidyltransferase with HDIG domain